MLSLSKRTDYALLALSYLTRVGERRAVNTKEIAEQYDLPVELLAKILQRLAKAELLTSTPGPTGGYRLARSAETISIGSVIEIVDGPPAIIHCLKAEHSDCDQLNKCTVRKPLARINARILQILNHISLAEINRDDEGEAEIPFVAHYERRSGLIPIA